ncbi:MAG: hypothetical protein ACRDT6_18445 [Micromonosporaceae bacterium]
MCRRDVAPCREDLPGCGLCLFAVAGLGVAVGVASPSGVVDAGGVGDVAGGVAADHDDDTFGGGTHRTGSGATGLGWCRGGWNVEGPAPAATPFQHRGGVVVGGALCPSPQSGEFA